MVRFRMRLVETLFVQTSLNCLNRINALLNAAYRVLVMGGSQGARILNQTLPEVMAKLGEGYEVRHQAGKDNQTEVEQTKLLVKLRCEEFPLPNLLMMLHRLMHGRIY